MNIKKILIGSIFLLSPLNSHVTTLTVPIPKIKKNKKITVKATCYNPHPNQGSKDHTVTASGKQIDIDNPLKHRWLAISRDLKKQFKFGDTVLISGTDQYDGMWIVNDLMAKRWKRKIDFLVGQNDHIARWSNITIEPK